MPSRAARTAYTSPEKLAALRDEQNQRLQQDEQAVTRFTKLAERARAMHQDGSIFDSEARSRQQSVELDKKALAAPAEAAVDIPDQLALPPIVGTCHPVDDGIWAVTLEALDLVNPDKPDEGGFEPTGRWALAHTSLDGTTTRFTPQLAFFDSPPTPRPIVDNMPHGVDFGDPRSPEAQMKAAFTTFDYDGDGHAEAIGAVWFKRISMNSDETIAWGQVVTVKDSAIVPYAAAKDIEVHDVRDVDGDGRPDLISVAQHHEDAPDDCESECSGEWVDDAPEVWRSLPDGSFKLVPPAPTKPATKEK